MILIEGAEVFRENGFETASVLIEGAEVIAVGRLDPPTGARVVDGSGCVLGPGFVDLHAHLRDPGQTWKEDTASGSRAAAAGGFTAVVAMANTVPPIDCAKVADEVRDMGRAVGLVEVIPAGTLTRGREGLEMSDLDGLYDAGVRIFTDDGDSVADAGLLRRILLYLADLPGAVVAEHPEDRTVSGEGHLHQGRIAAGHGIVGIPSIAEDLVVARDLELAAEVGARLHLQHLSTARAVELVRAAKSEGVAVSCEVTPHHLALDESALETLDPDRKMYPPLRTSADRAALVAGLRDGTIDAVATDHAPHAAFEKEVPFEESPRGVIGLETAAAVCLTAVGSDPGQMFEKLSVAPARIAGLTRQGRPVEPGSAANLVLFDPSASRVVDGSVSKAANTPFRGATLTGMPVMTIFEGTVTHERSRDAS